MRVYIAVIPGFVQCIPMRRGARERERGIVHELVSSWSLATRTPCEDATDRGDTRLISHATSCHDLIAGTRETTSVHVE